MAFALYHHAPAIPRQEPQGQVIGEGAGRHKDRGLLAEQRRDARFQLRHDAVPRIVVLGDAARLRDLGEKAQIGGR